MLKRHGTSNNGRQTKDALIMKELIDSIKSNVSNRIRNPFLGTLTFVYVYKNWEFFYALATLPTSEHIDKRIASIKPLFAKAISWDSILLVIGVTIGVFLASNVLLALSRLVVLFFSKKVNPRIDKVTDDKSIVSRNLYDEATNKISTLVERLEAEHKMVTSLRDERDTLQEKVLSILKEEPQKMENQTVSPIKTDAPKEVSNPLFEKLYMFIQNKSFGPAFETTIRFIRMDHPLPRNELVDELIKYSFICRNPKVLLSDHYIFTEEGNKFVQYYVLKK